MISIDEINRLKEENERLKREYNILDGIIDLNNAKIGQLQKENKQLKELFEIESLTDIKTGETMYRSRQIIHFVDILQEIKAIAEKEYNKKLVEKDCFDCDATFELIINLITKAEEE